MKINLYDAFDDLDVNQADKMNDSNMLFTVESDVSDRIKKNVFNTLNIENRAKKKSLKISSFRRLVAIVAVIVIFCCATTAGAVIHFKPDSAFAEYLTINGDVDLSTMGQDVNISSSSNGYEVILKQIISDNSTMHLIFDCPTKDGELLAPWSVNDIKVNGISYYDSWGNSGYILDDHSFALVFHDLKNIKNHDRITISFDRIENLYNKSNEADGRWNFEFDAVRANVKTRLDPSADTYKDIQGYEYKIKKLTVSPLGIYISYRQINGTSSDPVNENLNELAQEGKAAITVKMKDGTVYSDAPDNQSLMVSSSGTAISGMPITGSMGISFKEIIDVDEIESIILGEYEIYHS